MAGVQKSYLRRLLASLGIMAAVLLHGCGSSSAPVSTPGTYLGTPQPLGNGMVRSFVTIDNNGKPATMGVRVDAAALAGLSDTQASIITLDLPPEAGITPIDHIAFRYEPTGHPPLTLYDVPQFEVTFFLVTQAFQSQIQTVGADNFLKINKLAPADHVPPTFFEIPESAIPGFGVRYGYFQDPTLVNLGLTQSLDYFYYNGQMVAISPYVALNFLKLQTNRVDNVQTPLNYPKTGYWPSQIASGYDPNTSTYTIAVEGFVYR